MIESCVMLIVFKFAEKIKKIWNAEFILSSLNDFHENQLDLKVKLIKTVKMESRRLQKPGNQRYQHSEGSKAFINQ